MSATFPLISSFASFIVYRKTLSERCTILQPSRRKYNLLGLPGYFGIEWIEPRAGALTWGLGTKGSLNVFVLEDVSVEFIMLSR